MHVNVGRYCDASTTEPSEKKPTKVLMLSRWTPYCVAIGCFLDILSTFLPWGTNFGQELFLPFSIPLPLGWNAPNVAEAPFVLFVSVAIRLAAILGFAALLLYEYLKSILPTLVLLVSVGLSFTCFIISSQFGWSLSSGAYTALFGGLLKLLGLILRNLHLEIAEEENNEKTDPHG